MEGCCKFSQVLHKISEFLQMWVSSSFTASSIYSSIARLQVSEEKGGQSCDLTSLYCDLRSILSFGKIDRSVCDDVFGMTDVGGFLFSAYRFGNVIFASFGNFNRYKKKKIKNKKK